MKYVYVLERLTDLEESGLIGVYSNEELALISANKIIEEYNNEEWDSYIKSTESSALHEWSCSYWTIIITKIEIEE